MFKRRIVKAALALALASGIAHADNIVDTGTPSNNSANGWQFNKDQFFAGEFSLLGDGVINSIQGYFSTAAGNVGISVYTDGGDVPGSLAYSANLSTSVGGLAWNGVSDLNWALSSGDYWVVFAPDYASIYTVMQGGAPSPLASYAHTQFGTWFSTNDNVGITIDATVAAPVPEPTSIAMYGLGLVALVVTARRKQA